MEVRKPVIKSIPYNEFKDNDTLEKIVDQLHEGGCNVVLGSLGKKQLVVVAHFRYQLLWYRIHVCGLCAL